MLIARTLILPLLLAAAVAYAASPEHDPLAPIGLAKPPLATPEPVEETLYGTTLIDPYRYFEQMGSATVAWMTAQGDYTRRVFDSIAPRAALLQRISDFAGGFGFVQGVSMHGGRTFSKSARRLQTSSI